MLKQRIIPVLLWDGVSCVKGRGFNPGRRIGSMHDRVRLLERRDVDELIILDISATRNNRSPRFDEVKQLSENLFMPLTIGGGVKNCNDIQRLLLSGADKIAINTAAYDNPGLIDEAAKKFGSQAVVVSIDVNRASVHTHCGTKDRFCSPVHWATECEERGAGEILLNSIERDGSLDGYDLDTIAAVCAAVDIPVVVSGGAGDYRHFAEALKAGAHAVAAGALFQFCDATPKGASRYLHEQGFPVRL